MTDTSRPATPTLDRVAGPADLKALSDSALRRLADEVRAEVISVVSQTGGHLGSSLWVVELTVAIHAVWRGQGWCERAQRRGQGWCERAQRRGQGWCERAQRPVSQLPSVASFDGGPRCAASRRSAA